MRGKVSLHFEKHISFLCVCIIRVKEHHCRNLFMNINFICTYICTNISRLSIVTREGFHCWCLHTALVPSTRWIIQPQQLRKCDQKLISLVSQILIWTKQVSQFSHSKSEKALRDLCFGHFHAGFGIATQFEMVYLQQ